MTNTDSPLDDQINAFIKKWCGENAPHLLDNDENDGERLRQEAELYCHKQVIEARIDELEKSQRALQRPPKGIDTGRMNIDLIEWWFEDRLAELKALNHRKDKDE